MKACLALAALSLSAAEQIVLENGFRLEAKRHEVIGDRIVLHTANGTVELPRSQVSAIETLPEAETPTVVESPPPVSVAPAPDSGKPKDLFDQAADLSGLPKELLLSIAKVESAFQPNALSPKGAIGLMQLMPATAKALNVNPHDAQENVEGGARLMRQLLLKYENYPDQVYRALSAYNAGEGAVQKYNGIPPYRETRHYVEKVLNEYHRLKTGPVKYTEDRRQRR
ncbi:MAG: lytic transglycosylase domain-containing protein [Acidobacteria bacterium]|nr:lytic transglycosylase domain-containing protein [Acidobacteriota bacterium]